MDNPIVIIGFIVVMAAVFYFLFQRFLGGGKSRTSNIEDRVFDIDDRRVAPSGLKIWVEDIANVTEPEIRAIEKGLEDCFVKARLRGYGHPLKLSDYTVAIIGDCMRAPESGIWCYKLPAANYAGTEWDLGGFILAAGQVIATDSRGNVIILPDHKGGDLEQLRNIAMSETEHVVAHFSDPALAAARTNTHGVGQGHPIF